MTERDNRPLTGITIRPVGGLGNQLFIYAMGRAVAERLSCPLFVDLGYYSQSNPHDTPRVPELDWIIRPDQILTVTQQSRLSHLLTRVRTKFHLHDSQRVFQEHGFAYDSRIQEISIGTRLLGYFQSWKYFQSISDELRADILKQAPKSDWFQTEQRLLQELEPWIALHVRRGDYLATNNAQHHGLTGRDYYETAIKSIESKLGPCNLVLFSDEPSAAAELISTIHPITRVTKAPNDSHPMESIVLMSQANAIITANSSFSWWAAWLANLEPKLTFTPDPWFASAGNDERDLCPPQWVRLPSSLNN